MKFPEQYRHDHLLLPAVANDQKKGWFRIPHYKNRNCFFNAIAENFDNWQHVAVTVFKSGERSKRCATWDEMCFIKSLFWDDEEAVIQLHPPKSEYITNHPYCLHLWKPVNTDIPLPPSGRVGVKNEAQVKVILEKIVNDAMNRK